MIETLPPLTIPVPSALGVFEDVFLVLGDVTERSYPFPESLAKSVTKRRWEFATGRLCAERACIAAGARPPIAIGRKDRQPIWPRGIVGSITHTAEVAAAIAATSERYQGVGLDIERIARMHDGLHKMVLTEQELVLASQHTHYAARTFGAKEAGYKAINPSTGHFIGFKEAEIDFLNPDADVSEFTIRYLADNGPSRALHRGHGVSLVHGELCCSVFVIPCDSAGNSCMG